ncbi:hypothetical protein CLAIMM_09739 [Cladophialophora immunda]|nr:hypothetical protein CLAIMM_09739 [Cladophialophora immunda]
MAAEGSTVAFMAASECISLHQSSAAVKKWTREGMLAQSCIEIARAWSCATLSKAREAPGGRQWVWRGF